MRRSHRLGELLVNLAGLLCVLAMVRVHGSAQNPSSMPPPGAPQGESPIVVEEGQTIGTLSGAQTQVFSTILKPDPTDPEHATDPTGRNFHWDSTMNKWVNSETGRVTAFMGYLCAAPEPSATPPASATQNAGAPETPPSPGAPQGESPIVVEEGQTIGTLSGAQTQVFSTILKPDPTDPEHATDPTGRNFHWDSTMNKWVNSETGRVTAFMGYLCAAPEPSATSTPTGTKAPPSMAPRENKTVSFSGFTPTFQLRGFGGPSFINGNTPATSGFDGAVLFPLGNHILVGPTAGFQWANSSIVQTVGSQQPGSTFINTAAGFKSGNFGGQIQIPFMFSHPTGVHIDIHAGATVANSTITQAEGFCGLGNATSPAGCNVTSTTTTHNIVTGPFLGGYISHSIFPHVGVFAGYDWIHLKDTTSGGSTTGSSSGSQTLFDLNQNEIKLGIEIRIPITTHPPVLVSPTSTSPR